jgi:parallel beta-helix repeat protein
MSKLKLHIILALSLWLAFSGVAAAEQLYVNEGGWWREGGAFNVSTAPIQAAVGAAGEADSIYVWNGSYTENVDVDKPRLTLEGEGADVVTVTAASSSDHIFEVTKDYVNISGFAVRGATDSGMAGIHLNNVDYCNISKNEVYGNLYGIYMEYSSSNTLSDNTASSNNVYGVHLRSSDYNTLSRNTVNLNNVRGMYLEHSSGNTLSYNTVNLNNDHGIHLSSSSDNTLNDNNASGNNDGGIYLSSSNSNTLQGNTVNSNYEGICLSSSNGNVIACNGVQNNERGFYLSNSISNNISYNNIIKNGADAFPTPIFTPKSGVTPTPTPTPTPTQFYNDQPYTVEAQHNYWGAGMNNSTIDASIYDDEEGGWGKVEFYPFETEPVPCAPTPEESRTFTTTDAVITLQIAADSRPLDLHWDVSRDGSVTSLDALMILQAATGA